MTSVSDPPVGVCPPEPEGAAVRDPVAWLRRVVANKSTSWVRRRVVARRYLPHLLPAASGEHPGPDLDLTMRAALARLSPDQRAVVFLRYYLDLSEADTASTLGVPVGTVKSRLNRAMRALKEHRDGTDLDPEPDVQPEDDVLARLRTFIDTVPVPPPRQAPQPGAWTRWSRPLLAAAVAVLVIAISTSGLLHRTSPSSRAGDDTVLPARLPGYSWITADSQSSPPGRCSFAYQYGAQYELMDYAYFTVLSADGRRVRRLGLADAGDRRNGDWSAPSLLSPDGTLVAVGTGNAPAGATRRGAVSLVKLLTGHRRDIAMPDSVVIAPAT